MKSKCFFICLMLTSVMYASAQEVTYRPKDTYYYTHWTADTCRDESSFEQMYMVHMEPIRYAEFKRAIVGDKGIKVYGVAFCAIVDTCICNSATVTSRISYFTNNIEYPMLDSAYLRVQMRRYDNGAMTLMSETIVHPLDSLPRNYLKNSHLGYPDMPIYEAYFPEGVTVSDDTIYVGYFIPQPEGPFIYWNNVMNFHTWPISSAHLYQNPSSYLDKDSSMKDDYMILDTIGGEWRSHFVNYQWFDMYLFPIIAPYSPHTPQPHPQQGVEENREEVQVLLSPNPATHVAGVSASAVIERLEVYNAAGVKVYEGSPDYVIATLDVSRWASGVYLLKVHTAAGSVTKKLTVKH